MKHYLQSVRAVDVVEDIEPDAALGIRRVSGLLVEPKTILLPTLSSFADLPLLHAALLRGAALTAAAIAKSVTIVLGNIMAMNSLKVEGSKS